VKHDQLGQKISATKSESTETLYKSISSYPSSYSLPEERKVSSPPLAAGCFSQEMPKWPKHLRELRQLDNPCDSSAPNFLFRRIVVLFGDQPPFHPNTETEKMSFGSPQNIYLTSRKLFGVEDRFFFC